VALAGFGAPAAAESPTSDVKPAARAAAALSAAREEAAEAEAAADEWRKLSDDGLCGLTEALAATTAKTATTAAAGASATAHTATTAAAAASGSRSGVADAGAATSARAIGLPGGGGFRATACSRNVSIQEGGAVCASTDRSPGYALVAYEPSTEPAGEGSASDGRGIDDGGGGAGPDDRWRRQWRRRRRWQLRLERETDGEETTCIGVGRWPLTDPCHRTSGDLWTVCCRSGEAFRDGGRSGGGGGGAAAVWPIHNGDLVTFILEEGEEKGGTVATEGDRAVLPSSERSLSLSLEVNGEPQGVVFRGLPPGVQPAVAFYGRDKAVRFLGYQDDTAAVATLPPASGALAGETDPDDADGASADAGGADEMASFTHGRAENLHRDEACTPAAKLLEAVAVLARLHLPVPTVTEGSAAAVGSCSTNDGAVPPPSSPVALPSASGGGV
ncbi:unnamed protein product, partial [Phaeothamnion confervicola]